MADPVSVQLNQIATELNFKRLSDGVDGSGTLNVLAKFTPDGTTLGDSDLTDDGTELNYNAGKATIQASGETEIQNSLTLRQPS